MLFAHQVADKCFVVDVESLAVLAELDIALIDMLVFVPAVDLPLGVLLLKGC
jgi:hypothetical protein